MRERERGRGRGREGGREGGRKSLLAAFRGNAVFLT